MSTEIDSLNVAIVTAISALIAAVVAAIGLIYTGKSYTRLSKSEELRVLEAMNRDIGMIQLRRNHFTPANKVKYQIPCISNGKARRSTRLALKIFEKSDRK